MGLSAIACRILLFTSTVFLDPQNDVHLEFSTPEALPTSSLLLCANDPSLRWDPTSFIPLTLHEGGTLFDLDEQVVFDAASEGRWEGSDFVFRGRGRSSTSSQVGGLEFGGLASVLGTDPFYAGSFINQRYDDLQQQDSQGQSMHGLFGSREGSEEPSNCALLTGAWKQGTRYQLAFRMVNPSSSNSGGRSPATAFWLAPVDSEVVTTRLSADGKLEAKDTAFVVRGDKRGSMCNVRQQTQPILSELWDACAELASLDPGQVDADSTVPDCIDGLRQALAANPALANSFPFDRPPLTSYQLGSFAQAASDCGAGSTLAPRFGGECVVCSPGMTRDASTSPCRCQAGTVPRLIGPRMCNARSLGPAASGIEDLPAALCVIYTKHQESWKQRKVSDNVVARMYLKAFAASAAPVIDSASIFRANTTFIERFVFDERRPGYPTRRLGIKPSCHSCKGDSNEFTDVYTSNKVQVFDFHFEATNVFRFIGFLLDEVSSSPCTALWDRANPIEWKYTHHVDKVCKALPSFI